MTKIIFGCTHLENGIDSMFLSSNGGRLQNIAMAKELAPKTGAVKFYSEK